MIAQDCTAEVIVESLVERMKQSKFLSILADETTDSSTVEQLSLCVRYLTIDNDKCIVEEDFLQFVSLEKQDATSITNALLERMEKCGINMEKR